MKKNIEKKDPSGRKEKALILLFLLLSGSCGLVYEILWMKMLTLVIGNTVFAVTTVLTAFMGGLALGSFLAGRLVERIKKPLRIYGLLEGGIGIYALLLPLLIAGTEPIFRLVYQGFSPSFYGFGLLRFLVCGLLLLVPTTLMGATLPVLSRFFVNRPDNIGRSIGLLYGTNTFGAVLGCALAGFVLIPALGVTWTIYGAAFVNLAICAGVLKLSMNSVQWPDPAGNKANIKTKKQKKPKKQQQKAPRQSQKRKTDKGTQDLKPDVSPTLVWIVMAAIGLSGLAAMVYQIAWTRVITLAIGSSVYAFSLIVTAFVCGLALGSLAVARFIDRSRYLLPGLAVAQFAIGISALVIAPLLGTLPLFLAKFVFATDQSFIDIHLLEFAVIFVLILVPTLMMGAAVPMAVRICSSDSRRAARLFGSVYALNTLGAIGGSVMAGFCLIPWIGTQNSILVAAALNVLAAGIILFHVPGITLAVRRAGALSIAAIAMLAWLAIPRWDAAVLVSGPFLYSGKYKKIADEKGIELETAMKNKGRLLYFKEGLNALVSVQKSTLGDVSLKINGKTDASAKGGDVATQLMVGHLPLLLHPGARDVLVIGLGSGMTLAAVEKHPVKAVDVVEIEAAVVEASRHFRKFTGNVLSDPRVNLILADGRNHLALTRRQYDVIISEPSNPWIAGMANLFTREFFDSALARLPSGGLMCQWVHAYALSSMDFKTIVRTFQAVFPHTTLWEAAFSGDYLLIGSARELNINPRTLSDRLENERLAADVRKMRANSAAALISKLIMTETAIPEYVAGAPLHTDDNALLEYSAPRALRWHSAAETLAALYAHRQNPLNVLRFESSAPIPPEMARELLDRFAARNDVLAGFTYYKEGAAQDAMERLEHALTICPRDYDATYLLAKLYYRIGNRFRNEKRHNEAGRAYLKSVATTDNFIRATRGSLSDHFELAMSYSRANHYLGTLALGADRLEQAAAAFDKSLSVGVSYAEAHNNRGIVHERKGEYDAALNHYRLAVKLDPNFISAHMNMGNTLLKQKKYQQAITSYYQVRKLRPDFALTNYNLGMVYFEQAQWQKAEAAWEQALALKPDFDQVRQGLKAVRQKMRKP